ncbi:MAG: mandelate racemase [Acidobacteria bacterium]|nr:mandelate racemase [Acidobacteriota bacterium]
MPIDELAVSAYTLPLDEPESDGTLTWTATSVVVAEPRAEGVQGLGFTYGPTACAHLISELLAGVVLGRDPMDVPGAWTAMVRAIRNTGRPGVASMAIAAVDTALWDLKARLLEQPLARLLGMARTKVPVYGSGGFISMTDDALAAQLGGWVHDQGIPRVKIKIGSDRDSERVAHARRAIGPDAELFVDANGAYSRKHAVRMARLFDGERVTWFEEPVSSDDLDGLREVRDLVDVEVAAGEYGYDLVYFERMASAVDVLQADVSRCAGITEWLRAAAVAAAHGLEVSGHTAQSLHAHPACAVPNLRHLEYFADHARADRILFHGVLDPDGGSLEPDLTRNGCGLDLNRGAAERFRTA